GGAVGGAGGLLATWRGAFQDESGEPADDPARIVDERLPAGFFWLWDDDGPVSLACRSAPVAGVVRIQTVYTPLRSRRRGYGRARGGGISPPGPAAGDRGRRDARLPHPRAH